MILKIVKNFDSGFTLTPEAQEMLFGLLKNDQFLQKVSQQVQGKRVEFTEILFQPVPYSEQTPKGMPPEFEQYCDSKEYIIINVPPKFMVTAKIFRPNQLCAIYKIVEISN